METEIWKSLPGVPGAEVSTLGRVRTLDMVTSSEKMTRFTKGRVLKQFENHNGYMIVNIQVDGKGTTKRVHRLVAQTFIKNTDCSPQVNHLDCDRKNNNVSNLEWCTALYNNQYREKFGKSKGLPVFAINLKTHEVSRFKSQQEASHVLGVSRPNINAVIKCSRKQTGGYWFVNADGNTVDIVKSKLHDIGKTGLKI